MKKITLLICSLVFVSNFAQALSLQELAGKYKISSPELPIKNTITLKKNGAVTLLEESPIGKMSCKGKASLVSDVLSSEVVCTNGQRFQQRINFSGVDINQDTFEVSVYSSLYQAEAVMQVERVKNAPRVR
jgi:hypothetical protein